MESRTVTIESGRDKGLSFKITEMNAFDMEELLIDVARIAGGALAKSGGTATSGEMKDVGIKLLGGVSREDMKDVMERLMKQVVWLDSDQKNAPRMVSSAPIKDVSTLLTLKKEVVALHLSFLAAENPLLKELTDTLGLSI